MNGKKLFIKPGIIILAALIASWLASCSGAPIPASASSGLTEATKLALGTLKLESSTNAVTPAQAKELLTLWQGYQSVSSSDTTSQVELEALAKQIEQAMSSNQLKAIEAMDLTSQSVTEALSTLGGSTTSNAPSGTPSAASLVPSGATDEPGTMPAGGSGGPGGIPPSGSGGMMAGGDSSGIGELLNGTNTQGTAVATQAPAATGSTQVNPMLLRAVIQLLETRSQAAG